MRDSIAVATNRIDEPEPVRFIKPMRHRLSWSAYKSPLEAISRLGLLDHCAATHDFGIDETADVVRAIRDSGLDSLVVPLAGPGCPENSVAYIRKLIATAAEAGSEPEADVVRAITDTLELVLEYTINGERAMRKMLKAKAQQEERRARAHLPGYDEYDKLMRYKKAHENAADNYLRQLETLQRARTGTLLPAMRIQGLES